MVLVGMKLKAQISRDNPSQSYILSFHYFLLEKVYKQFGVVNIDRKTLYKFTEDCTIWYQVRNAYSAGLMVCSRFELS